MQKFKLSCQTRGRMRSQLPQLFLLPDVHKRLPLLQLIQGTWERLRVLLGPIYTKHQRQRCDHSAMRLAILFTLKTMELLQIWVAAHFEATALFSIKPLSPASSQRQY